MNKNVIEILNFLLTKILKEDDIEENREKIVIKLENKGYTIEDINSAFDFITNGRLKPYDERISQVTDTDFYIDRNSNSGYNRVLAESEKRIFNDEIKSLIYRINELKVLKAYEFELLLEHMFHNGVYEDLEAEDIWDLIDVLVKDTDTKIIISQAISEFNDFYFKNNNVN
jgi:Smg protein